MQLITQKYILFLQLKIKSALLQGSLYTYEVRFL